MHIAAAHRQQFRHRFLRDERLTQALAREKRPRNADVVHKQLSGIICALPDEMPNLRQSERKRPMCLYRKRNDPPRIRLHAARHIDRERLFPGRIYLLNETDHRLAKFPLHTRAEDAVHNAVCKAQRNAQAIPVSIALKRTHLHAHRPNGIVHRARRIAKTLLISGKKQLDARAHIHQMPCGSKGITAVVAAARKDADGLPSCASDERHRFLRCAPSRILHESKCRETVLPDNAFVNRPHIRCKCDIHNDPSKTQYAVAYSFS